MFGLSMITDKMYKGLTLVLIVATVFLFIQGKIFESEKDKAIAEKERVVADHNKKVADMQKALRESDEKVFNLTLKLSTTISTLEAKRNDEVNKIRVSSNAVIAGLQLRASRTTRPPAVPGEANKCSAATTNGTGASLFREDGEFLVREATRADEQREALRTCYGAWDAVIKTIKEFNTPVTAAAAPTIEAK